MCGCSKPADDTFNVEVGGRVFEQVVSHMDASSHIVTSFFAHTRLDTTVVRDEDTIIVFQRGTQYRLTVPRAKWMEKALGMKDVTNSVLAPMPCKILRVEVQAGDVVEKDQPLVVIESMKMETVIRSPQRGTIARVVHRQGVSHAPFPLARRIRDPVILFVFLLLLSVCFVSRCFAITWRLDPCVVLLLSCGSPMALTFTVSLETPKREQTNKLPPKFEDR